MARVTGAVAVDTNTIIETHRVGAWKALASGYRLETVEDVVAETATGFQKRNPAEQIDQVALMRSLAAVHAVTPIELATVVLKAEEIQLDAGEKAVWAHLLTRNDVWMLCGPDKASLRFGVRMGFRERMISLESLLQDIGMKPKLDLKNAYSRQWLDANLSQYVVMEQGRKR
jgi:hypothetical protein